MLRARHKLDLAEVGTGVNVGECRGLAVSPHLLDARCNAELAEVPTSPYHLGIGDDGGWGSI